MTRLLAILLLLAGCTTAVVLTRAQKYQQAAKIVEAHKPPVVGSAAVESLVIRTNPPQVPITNITLLWDNHSMFISYKIYSTTNLLAGFQFRTNADGPGVVFKTQGQQQEFFKVSWTNEVWREGGWL